MRDQPQDRLLAWLPPHLAERSRRPNRRPVATHGALAFNFCFHTVDPERIEALPAWAQATLREHAGDTRPVIVDPESLARSRTGAALWDLAQASLRIHGELHNNLRMRPGPRRSSPGAPIPRRRSTA
jgi:hypothetical protein